MKPLRLILTTLILAAPLSAQQDSDISLSVRFLNRTSRFHVGEVIPLELSFKASSLVVYDMEMRNYDRSGRLDIEQEPARECERRGRGTLQRHLRRSLG